MSSVQFIRFPMTAEQIAALGDLNRAAEIWIDHPALTVHGPVPGTVRAALLEDLAALR